MIGRRAEEVLNRAVRFAYERQHEYFTLEHILLSLLEEPEILEVLQACNVSYLDVQKELETYLSKEIPSKEFAEREGISETALTPKKGEDEEGIPQHPIATLSIQRLIQRALFHVQSAGKDEITPEDLLVSLFQSKDSFALHTLKKRGAQRLDVIQFLSHGSTSQDGASVNSDDVENEGVNEIAREATGTPKNKVRGRDVLDQYTLCLNDLARDGKMDPLIGRKDELDRMIQTLCRRTKNNPLLVGEAGVGKTALAEGLALKIVKGEIPKLLANAEIYSLDMGSVLAGAKFRGDFEQRLKKILKALQERREEGKKPILFIDEIHTIVGAGSVSGGALDAANLLKPFLSRGEVHCIGSTTYQEYRTVFEKDHALARRFQKIEVNEPSMEEAIQILEGLKERFEAHHHVSYTSESLKAAVELSSKHITDRHLPDKAIDVIDEAGARLRLERMGAAETNEVPVIEATQIEEMIAKIARIPARTVSTSQKNRIQNLDRDLKLAVFGQDQAVETVVGAIRLARSGLRSGDRPMGSFLFCGPTGVGKTELARQLAHCLGIPLLRFDMSEYMEKHTVSRLIGAPPGYVGFDQAGLLTDALQKNPHSVVLLDEIEKAHPDLWNILLQVMDHGFLTDNNGKKSDFRNALLIMTSNVGSRENDRRTMGVRSQDNVQSFSNKEVERTFSPEFRNRLDSIVVFNGLDPLTIAQVVGKQLIELESQLLAKKVEMEVTPEVREWLAQTGYDAKMGARPMARLIQDKIKRPLSEEVLFGKLEKGGQVRLTIVDDKIHFEFVESQHVREEQTPVGLLPHTL